MAKLSARRRTQVYRIEKDGMKVALMSDDVILVNYGGGWKKRGKIKLDVTAEQWLQSRLQQGWRQIER